MESLIQLMLSLQYKLLHISLLILKMLQLQVQALY